MNAEHITETGALARMLEESEGAISLPYGFHSDIPEALYHRRRLGLVSKHALDLVRRSPRAYKAYVDGESEPDTASFAFGRAVHCALLEPERFAREYLVEPEWGPLRLTYGPDGETVVCTKEEGKANKTAREQWRKEHPTGGRFTLLSAADMAIVIGNAASIAGKPIVCAPLLDSGESEVTLRWRDASTGLECKGRVDKWRPDIRVAIDYKSAESASEEAFRRDAARYGYHRQAALYMDGFAAIGQPIDAFLFVVGEKTPPYDVGVYRFEEEDLLTGYQQNANAMAMLARCLETSEWPGLPDAIRTVSLPPWSKAA